MDIKSVLNVAPPPPPPPPPAPEKRIEVTISLTIEEAKRVRAVYGNLGNKADDLYRYAARIALDHKPEGDENAAAQTMDALRWKLAYQLADRLSEERNR